ncbi:bifunctional adenosylcobinamide kinase/adenosylcobinamide-phosphate guanylyltransferase [Comamonas flocculans]|uniref:Bifunctional adenosylcobalamin biosynthesis protein n=1 Tax=Comamonas flocculans TaxID=2597701 RepID=A0A5B8S0B8_9BURK|nr:bifunctional adenosylcobinamide kinase/adenosylcobinamide-phosphate guanylyltransferase [Comamonas flocculans]
MVRSELILGGQKSGKSRRAEALAADWLARDAAHQAVLLATGQAHDAEMRARIARHQADRRERAPRLQTVDAPLDLAAALRQCSAAQTLVVVDCLTLWLTNQRMPWAEKEEQKQPQTQDWQAQQALFFEFLEHPPGPVVLVGNEIGLGVIPLGREVRQFVDALGLLNQRAAAACERVTLMVAGLPLTVKGRP